jgi:hypothetical protein
MRALRIIFPVLLAFLLASSISTMAFNWWQAAAGAGSGAAAGAAVGSLFPGLGTLAGAGVGALAGFIGASIVQLFGQAPTTSASFSTWYNYARNSVQAIYEESQLIADQETDQVSLLQTASMPFTITAQKWEQVNYNINDPPSSPQEFYQMLSQTGFLDYARKLIGGSQSLWVDEEGMISALNQQLSPYEMSVSYNTDPGATTVITVAPSSPVYYYIIVFGQVNISSVASLGITTVSGSPPNVQNGTYSTTYTLNEGVYVIYFPAYSSVSIMIDPEQGAMLAFQYDPSTNSYSPVNWGFNTPTTLTLNVNGNANTTFDIPQTSATLPFTAEQIAVNMLGAAMTEYTVLKNLGYQYASQVPPNMTLPTIDLNIGNFSTFNSSLQVYNLYLSEYTRQLLQLQQTLQALSQEGKLAGLEKLALNATNPLSTYGQYGGFVENGTILLPSGQTLRGLFLVQPYGGPLSLTSNGGTVGNGGAIAYQLVPAGNNTYGLGTMYILQPGTIIQGNVANPGTLQPVTPLHVVYYYNASAPQPPPSGDSSDGLLNYLKSHPLVLVASGLFLIIVAVVIVRSL